ncbi:MAG TPA: ABC transporter ATP-binding protein [Acidobacteriota bacterium]|nr:ABC transporter ATP-binding protein [Acidobacteriota bacterium]
MTTGKSEPLLRLDRVSRQYTQGEQTVYALRDVTFTAEKGEFIAIAGPSGSGKTTLLNLCAGLDRPTEGTVWLNGRNLAELNRHQLARLRLEEVGFIFQAFNLIPVLSAEENAEFILLLRGVPARERKEKVRALLKEVGLQGMESRRPGQLSGGQQQRVAVARAIAAEPKLVLADEPTANLDTETAFALLNLLERLNREHGTTFLFSTHDPRVMQRAHRIIRLLDGRIEIDEQVPTFNRG